MPKIALVQQHASSDRDDNLARGVAAVRAAAAAGAKLVCFAELAFEPFWPQRPATPETLALAETIPGRTATAFCDVARETGTVIVPNLYERDGDRNYDSSPVIDADGRILGVTRMVHIAEMPCFHEKGFYAEGDQGAPVFETAVGRIGVAICYDRHFPEYMRALGVAGAEIVVTPQAGAVGEWPDGLYEAEMRVAAFQNGYFTALANRVGEEECVTFAGRSFVCNPEGAVVAQAPDTEDAILYADLDLSEVQSSHARTLFFRDRRPEEYPDWI
jgi:predicted amidohydrolase